jgi:hypothetical protein
MAGKISEKTKAITPKQIANLCSLGCTNEEIAGHFGVSADTIERRFKDALEAGRANRNISLRKWQFGKARKGSDTMLIFLGKQYLGQSDKMQQQIESVIVEIPEQKIKEKDE